MAYIRVTIEQSMLADVMTRAIVYYSERAMTEKRDAVVDAFELATNTMEKTEAPNA